MYHRDRVSTCLDRARRSAKKLQAVVEPQEKQSAWEDFLEDWKKALERLRSYALKAGMRDKHDAIHNERVGDPILNYAWEARNVEAHDIDGGSRPTGSSWTLQPHTPGGPVHIHQLTMGPFGSFGSWTGASFRHAAAELSLIELTLKGGKKLAPPDEPVEKVADHALAFAERHFAFIFRPNAP